MSKVIQLIGKSLEKLRDDYTTVHDYVHEVEDRLDAYRGLHEEMQEFLQEHLLDKIVRKKTRIVLDGLKELIDTGEKNMETANTKKSILFKRCNQGLLN